MVLPDGRYWIERQSLRQLRTGRDLLPRPDAGKGTGMVAFGDVDYTQFPTADSKQPGGTPNPLPAMADQQLAMNQRLRSERGAFSQLMHTGPETGRWRTTTGTPAKERPNSCTEPKPAKPA